MNNREYFRTYLDIALKNSGLNIKPEEVEHPWWPGELISIQIGPILIWEEQDTILNLPLWHADMMTVIYDNHGIPGPSEAMGDYIELFHDVDPKNMTEIIVKSVCLLVEERIKDEIFNFDMERFYEEEIKQDYLHQEQGVQ